jgi:hypothetical protein
LSEFTSREVIGNVTRRTLAQLHDDVLTDRTPAHAPEYERGARELANAVQLADDDLDLDPMTRAKKLLDLSREVRAFDFDAGVAEAMEVQAEILSGRAPAPEPLLDPDARFERAKSVLTTTKEQP